jgi:SRSO17 transposase
VSDSTFNLFAGWWLRRIERLVFALRVKETILLCRFTSLKDFTGGSSRMTLEQIAALGRKLSLFLALFADCFGRREGRGLLRVYVQGQLSSLHRKTAEAIALQFGTAPRTLQRFLESIKWDEEQLRNRCQQIIASEHAHPEAIGCVDESGTTKSGKETVGVGRQYNGNRGKIDNCVVGVHLSYAAPGFQVLLDSELYLPEAFANDAARRKKHTCPRRSSSAPNRRSPWN